MSPSPESATPSIGSLALAVYVPIVIFAIGEGAVIPFIVLGAQDRGASASLAGGIFALTGAASILFAIPAGALISRFGGRWAASASVGSVVVGLLGVVLGSSVAVYALSIFVLGAGWATWRLVRFDFLVGVVGVDKRGRALAVMGGAQRLGRFVGPLLAAAAAIVVGLNGAFLLHMGVAVVALIVFVSVPLTDVEKRPRRQRLKLRGLVSEHKASFGVAGTGLIFLIILRSARPVAVPLWAIHIGLDPAAVGVIFGVSSAIDTAMFYPAGVVMDRFGRKWAVIPSVVLLAVSFLVMPLAAGFGSLLIVGLLMGLGNGFGSGYGATLGSDLAPTEGRAEFLGMWSIVANVGTIGGPLILGGIVAIASLGVASVAIGVIGIVGAAHITLLVPETLVRPDG